MAYIPNLGGAQDANFPLQFADASIDPMSLSCTLINQLSNDGSGSVVAHGSGCFYRHLGKLFLLTARHVLSGRSPFDDKLMSPSGFVPARVRLFPTLRLGENYSRVSMDVDVIRNDQPLWLQDPAFDLLRTDIALLPINFDGSETVKCINDTEFDHRNIFSHVGVDFAVVGYPNINFTGLMTPIWRRATIASEPCLPVDGKPMFLLDASTGPGFSGAPVFRQHFGPLPVRDENGNIGIHASNVRTLQLVGIYAGRLANIHVGGEVPFVFYANRIQFILGGL